MVSVRSQGFRINQGGEEWEQFLGQAFKSQLWPADQTGVLLGSFQVWMCERNRGWRRASLQTLADAAVTNRAGHLRWTTLLQTLRTRRAHFSGRAVPRPETKSPVKDKHMWHLEKVCLLPLHVHGQQICLLLFSSCPTRSTDTSIKE